MKRITETIILLFLTFGSGALFAQQDAQKVLEPKEGLDLASLSTTVETPNSSNTETLKEQRASPIVWETKVVTADASNTAPSNVEREKAAGVVQLLEQRPANPKDQDN